MAAEYLANVVQTVVLNSPVIFTASIPCTRGYIYHEDETGIFILRGIVNNACARFATYQVTFNGNIAVPEGGTAGEIALAITVNGEARPTSTAISTPTVVQSFDNVTSTAIIKVPRGCCFTVSVRAITGADGVDVQNANLVINRIA